MRQLVLLAVASATGCVIKPITEIGLTGTVFDGPDSIDGVPNATVEMRTYDGALFDSVMANPSGTFTIRAPAGQPAFMVVSSEDHTPTSFTVNIGTVDMDVPERAIWARRASIHESMFEDFEGCSPSDTTGGVLEGEVRLYLGDVEERGSEPLVSTAVVYLETAAGELHQGCHLDNAGTSDPDSTVTGETGRYAIFDAPEGVAVLTVTYDTGDSRLTTELLVYVPEGGTVPGYPTYVSLP